MLNSAVDRSVRPGARTRSLGVAQKLTDILERLSLAKKKRRKHEFKPEGKLAGISTIKLEHLEDISEQDSIK